MTCFRWCSFGINLELDVCHLVSSINHNTVVECKLLDCCGYLVTGLEFAPITRWETVENQDFSTWTVISKHCLLQERRTRFVVLLIDMNNWEWPIIGFVKRLISYIFKSRVYWIREDSSIEM